MLSAFAVGRNAVMFPHLTLSGCDLPGHRGVHVGPSFLTTANKEKKTGSYVILLDLVLCVLDKMFRSIY